MEERRRCTTVQQLEVMLEFLEGHRDLALGRVRSKEARAVSQRLWQECAELLNGLGPARTAKEWSKVWNDQKTKVRAKLLKINASQRATGGGPSNAPTLTPLEDKVANIIGRDVGPLPNVAQDHFAVHEGDTLNEAENIIVEEIHVVEGENIEEVEGVNISPSQLNMEAVEHEDVVEVPQEEIEPLQSQLVPLATTAADRARRTRERRRLARAPRAPVAQPSVSHQTPPAPQGQSARSALDESRKMVIKIEELKAQTALENAQAANKNAQAAHETAGALNTLSQSFKLIAESIDRMSRQFYAPQANQRQPE